MTAASVAAPFIDNVASQPGTANAVTNGNLLSTALTNARGRAGDTIIVLTAGHEFHATGGFLLSKKSVAGVDDGGYVTIQSSQLDLLPEGKRVIPLTSGGAPLDTLKMAAIRVTGQQNASAVRVTTGRHFRLRGLDISSTHTGNMTHMVMLGTDSQTDQNLQAAYIEIDRCYIHASSDTQSLGRTVRLDAGNTIIRDSHLSGAKTMAQPEAHAIGGVNGMGPYFIINNYLEAAGENFILGGGTAQLLPDGTAPKNIHFKRNFVTKPLEWRTAGWLVKNLFEMKLGIGYDIEGNVFENHWVMTGGQSFAIVMKSTSNTQANTQLDIRTEDVVFRNNKIAHAGGGVHLEGRDYYKNWPPTMKRVQIRNNVFDDISHLTWGSVGSNLAGSFAYFTNGTIDTTFENNTIFDPTRYYLYLEGSSTYPHTNLTFRNNIGKIGMSVKSASGTGSAAFNTVTTGTSFISNVMMGGSSGLFAGHPNNWWPSSWTGVLGSGSWTQSNPGPDLLGYQVVNPSVYYTNAAPGNGKPIGADIPTINAATYGCKTGVWNNADIVLYPGDGTAIRPTGSSFVVETDPIAADGVKMRDPNLSTPRVDTPLTNPTNRFEMTFNAKANTPYRLWMRMKADSDSNSNDSVWVQFNNSVDAAGNAIFRSGTTNGTIVALEAIFPDGVQGWGWSDNDLVGGNGNGTLIRFASDGAQTIRVQRREDGVAIDQIVLSPCTYVGGGYILDTAGVKIGQGADPSPGSLKGDSTILPKTSSAATPSTLIAYEGFNYTVPGSLNGNNGGTGFGANAWVAGPSPNVNPTLAAGTMTYSDGTNSLVSGGNKVQPTGTSRSIRNFASAITTAGTTKWVAFRMNHTGTGDLPTNHAGFGLYSGTGASGTEIFLGKPGGQINWGITHSATTQAIPGSVTAASRDALLVYKLEFTGSVVNVTLWVDPSLASEPSVGTAAMTFSKAHTTNIASMNISTGTNASDFQLDEFRIGGTFIDVAPR